MKKFITGILVITLLSIGYVFQHTRLLEYSYNINTRQEDIALLIDRNRNLRYNIAKLETPARLEETVQAEEKGFIMPQSWHKIRIKEDVPGPKEAVVQAGNYNRVGRIILSMFSFGAEAVANDSN